MLLGRETTEIVHVESDLDGVDDFLQRLIGTGPLEASAQDRVLVGDALPGVTQHLHIDCFGEVPDHLLDVDPDVGPLQVVEQHALLDRSEEVRINYRAH